VTDPGVPATAVFHRMTNAISATNTTDNYQVSYHGLGLSHMDSFCHFFADGTLYNGYKVADNIPPETGCKKDSIMAWKDGIVTRGVLYDIPLVAGYYADVVPWIKEREVSFIGRDFNIDWNPRPGWGAAEGIPGNPIHQAVLNWMDVNIIENLDLEQAAETARRLKRYEFALTFAPIPVEGGTGSPINPLAVF
jgi:hypothetical protein